jgi:hypothetical protein
VRTKEQQEEIEMDRIFRALTSVIAFVRPPVGYLESVGISEHNVKVIDRMFDEYYKPTISFEEYLIRKENSHIPHVREDCAQWVAWYKEAVEEVIAYERN